MDVAGGAGVQGAAAVDVAGAAAVDVAAGGGGGRGRGGGGGAGLGSGGVERRRAVEGIVSRARVLLRLSEKRPRGRSSGAGEETDRAAPRVSEAKHFCGAPAGSAPQKVSRTFVAHRGGAAPQKDTFLWRTVVGVRHRYLCARFSAVAVFFAINCWQLLLAIFFVIAFFAINSS